MVEDILFAAQNSRHFDTLSGAHHTLNVESNTLYYMPDTDPSKAVVQINGVDMSDTAPIHPVTVSKANGVTPRIKVPSDFAARLDPTPVDRKSGGDIQEAIWQEDGTRCVVVFASANSSDERCRALYDVYRKDRAALAKAYENMPNAATHTDDLAGGVCK